MTEPSNPAFSAIWRTGAVNALSTIFTPVSMSPSASISLTFGKHLLVQYHHLQQYLLQLLRVEFKASSIRNLRSLSSVSLAAPTLITATPPANLAKRSCNFSRSKSDSVSSI